MCGTVHRPQFKELLKNQRSKIVVRFQLTKSPHPFPLSWSLGFPVRGELRQAQPERENEDVNRSDQKMPFSGGRPPDHWPEQFRWSRISGGRLLAAQLLV
jgi:hypothetical protein